MIIPRRNSGTEFGLSPSKWRALSETKAPFHFGPEWPADRTHRALVDLTSHFAGEERIAQHFQVVPCDLPRGCTATYFPETNMLVPINSVAERSNTPTSKFIIITVAPSADADEAVQQVFKSRSA